MKYLIWRLQHLHSRYVILRRGKTVYCGTCHDHHNLNK